MCEMFKHLRNIQFVFWPWRFSRPRWIDLRNRYYGSFFIGAFVFGPFEFRVWKDRPK